MDKIQLPDGSLVSIEQAQSLFNDQYQTFIDNGTLKIVSEEQMSNNIFISPDGSEMTEKQARDLYKKQFQSFVNDGTLKKKGDTPSDGQEEVTESITETPTELGSLDSSQENVEQPVIPLVETDGDLSEPPIEIAEEAVEVLPEQPKKISQQEKDYNDWNSLGFLTEDEKKAAQEIYLKEQQGDFGIVSNISNIIKSTPKTIYGITNNPFSNPEGVSKARSINEIEDAEIRKKRIDFLNKIDSPERRKAIEKMIKTDKWESNQERIDITKNLEGSEIVLNNLSSRADFLIKRRTELLELEITGQTTEKERLALLNEFKEIQSELSDIKKEGQKIISSYDGLAKNYEENSQDLGSFDQELELLKKDYQFFSNAMNIVSTGFEDIVDNISYQTLRAFNSQLDSSIETLKKDALFNPDDIDNELYDNMSKSNTRAGKKILDISLEKKKKREKEREFFTPSVAAEDISSVMDFVDFTIDGVLNTTPTLIQLGVPYVGQASFLLSQQASNELSIRQGIIDRESELKEINEILEDSGLSSEDLSSLTKRKKQLENQPTPSETAIFAASGAMAVSELAFARVGKIRLLNKAKRTAQAIGKKSLVDNIKKTWGKKWAGTAFDFTKDISGEGLEEVGVNLVTNIAEMYVIGDMYNTDGTTRSILDGTFEAGLGGLSTGGVLSGTTKVAGIAANSISDRKRRKQVLGNVLQINNYLKELDNSNISVELKDIISEQIKELNKKNGEIINATLQTYDELSPEDRKEVGRIDGEFNAKSVALTELLKKENRNEELVKSLQNQLDALDSKKASILDNKTKDTPREFTNEAVSSLKEEGIDDPTLNQVLDKMEQLTKQKEDAISKPSTEEQVLPDAPTSTEGGKDSEVELQQVGEGDVEQVTPDTQVQEGETQTDKPSDKTAETDVEFLKPNAPDSAGRYENYSSDKVEVNISAQNDQGQPSTGKKTDYRFEVRVNTSQDGQMTRSNALTKTFKTSAEAKAYAEKIAANDAAKTKKTDTEQVTQPTSTEEGMSVNRDRYQVPGSRTIDVEVDESGKPTVVNRKTGKKVDRVPAKAQDFILTNVVDVNEGSKAKIPEGANPEQVVNEIAENSNNIKEVSEAINQLRTESENTQESKDIGGELGGLVNQKTKRPAIKFTAKSWKRVTGLSPKESGVSNSWIATEANGGVSIEDGFLDIVSLPGELPVDTNQRISSDQVVEFIKQYPNANALKEANTSTQLTDLEIKFEQLTGLKATPRNIETVVGIDPNREPIALTKERSKESTTKESAEKESEGVSKLRDALRKSGTTVKRNTAEQISKLGKQIENAKKALSKILPDVEIIMPSSEAEYKRLTGESNTDNSGGTYIDGKIYINPNRASSRVVSHEVFHAVLLSKGMSEAQAKAITERMLSAVKKSASKELLDKIDKFSKRYPEALQSEESIAELVGILASEYDTLPKPSQNIVKRWLDKLAKIFGLKPFTDVEVVDLLNTLASKVESGQEVSAKDVKILKGKDSKNKTEARKSRDKSNLAPNGKPSNLNTEQYNIVRTPEFKNWFGDWQTDPENASKVVDENGEPLVTYHGSAADFDVFSKEKLGSLTNTEIAKAGFFFASNKAAADQYAFIGGLQNPYLENKLTEARAFFINIKNPYKGTNKEWNDLLNWASDGSRKYDSPTALKKANKEFKESLLEDNFDGVDFDNGLEIVAFEPTQAKIADGSNTEFDPNNPSIRKSSSKPTIEEIVTKGKEIGSSDADIREVAQQEGYANKDTNSEIEKYDTKKREAAQKAEKLFVKGGKIAKSLDFLRRWALSARGFLPKSMQIGKEVLTGAVAANAKQAENNLKDLQRYIKKQKKSVQDKLVQDLNSYMRGDADIDTLPAKLRPIAYAMRNHIDSLSMSLVESGAITDIKFDQLSPKQKKELIKEFGTEAEARKNYKSQKDNIIDNLGSYLNRSFEVFDSENYSPSDAVLNAAKVKLREQYAEAAKEKALEENNDVDAVLEEMVDNALEKILSREEGREFLNSSKLGSKNISVLKEKIDIPAEIRALMGEYTDPALNYVRSVNKIAALVANQEFLSKMKKAGEGVFFFNKPTGEYDQLIAPKGSDTYNPLNGMYTSKAIRDAVLNIPGAKINDKTISAGLSFIYKAVGAVKYGKTILSPATHAKNIIGNLFFMAYNGYANPKEYFDAANVVISDLKGNFITRKIFKKNKTENRKKMQEYIKLGIINQSSNLGEIRSLLQSEGSLENLMSKRNQGDKTPLKRLKRFFKRSGKVAESAYQAEDDVFKIISFEMEKKRYSKALFNKTFDKLSPEQQKEVTEKVTEIVKNILPNYSRIGNIGKFMKAVPIFGTFISFQIEAMRTAYNVAQLALSEIQNPNTAGIGLKRLTGIFSVMAVKSAILPMFGVAGQTLTEAVKSALGDEDEDEEVEKKGDVITESARQFLPKWAENSSVIITKLDNGKFDYINFSASDPHSFIDQAIISAFRGETAAEGMGNALNSLIEPFVTFDILFKAVTSIETDYGKQIYNETDTPNEVAEKFGAIVYKTFEPGGVTSARKLLKAYEDKDKSLKNEIIGQLTGFKVHTVDFEKQLIFKSLDLRKRVDLASKDYSKAYYERKNKDISEDDLEKRYDVANDKYKQIIKEGVRFYSSSLKLGSSRSKSYKSMYGYKRLSRYEMSYIRNGNIPELKKKKTDKYKLK